MYFWKVNALVEDLKNRRVSQRQKMHYYLANALFTLACIYITSLLPVKPNVFTVINIIFGLCITVGGVLLCYEANNQGDDEEFIDRIVCLSWPINVRMIGILILVYIVYGFFLANSSGGTETTIFDVAIMTFYSIYWSCCMNQKFGRFGYLNLQEQ